MASTKALNDTSVAFSTRPSGDVAKALDPYCTNKATTKVAVIDKALRKLLKLPA